MVGGGSSRTKMEGKEDMEVSSERWRRRRRIMMIIRDGSSMR